MPEDSLQLENTAIEPSKKRRRKRESASRQQYLLLFVLILFSFGPLLLSTELWNPKAPATASGFHEIASWSDAWNPERIRKYDPISLTSYFFETLLPLNPASIHRLINIGLHVFSVCLLWSLLRKMRFGKTWLACLFFALHPAVIPVLFWPGYRHILLGFIIILAVLNLAEGNLNARRYMILLALSTVGVFINTQLLFLPIILALITYSKNYPVKLNQFNWILPILCINLFLSVWLYGERGLTETTFVLSEWSFKSGHYMQHLLKQSFIPTELHFYTPLPENISYSINTGINLAPFLLYPPFIVLGIINRQHQWARNLLLGVISYVLLVFPTVSTTGTFIDGSPAFELFAYYPALATLCVFVVLSLEKLSGKLGEMVGVVLTAAFYITLGILCIFSFTYALDLRNPQKIWQSIANQWPQSNQAQIAYLESMMLNGAASVKKDALILKMQALLEKDPDLLEIRKLMARTMRDANQPNNALREFRRILREETDDLIFLSEAADFLDFRNLRFEAEKVRQRIDNMSEAKSANGME